MENKTTFKLTLADGDGVVINQWKVKDRYLPEDDETEILFWEESLAPGQNLRSGVVSTIGDDVLFEIENAIKRRDSK